MKNIECEYRNNLCQIEALLNERAPSSVEGYVEVYCHGDKKRCAQYKAIKEGWTSMIEKEINKAETEVVRAVGKYLSLQLLKALRS